MESEKKETIPTKTIDTVEGPIQGVVEGEISTFRGIPYAAPPVGALARARARARRAVD